MGARLSPLTALIITALLSFSAWALPPKELPRCDQLLSEHNFIASDEVIDIADNTLVYHDLGYDFHFQAGVRDRVLALDVMLVDPDRKIRSHYSGSNLYQLAMEHFGPLNIDIIEGLWQSGDNYEGFLANLAKGLSPKEAAAQTWSGRQAARYGFTEVEVIHWGWSVVQGSSIVSVEFKKP